MTNQHNDLNDIVLSIVRKITRLDLKVIGIKQLQYGSQIIIEDDFYEILKLNVYVNHKGTKIVPSSQESNIYNTLKSMLEQYSNIEPVKYCYIGTDESGKGDYFGPLVIAGFVSDEHRDKELQEMQVKDSKLLNEEQIINISNEIKIKYRNYYNILIIEPKEYNKQYSDLLLEGKKLNALLGSGHSKIIQSLITNNSSVRGIITDQFGDLDYLNNAMKSKSINLDLQQVTKAEKYMAVAASSILARSEYLKWMRKNSNSLNISLPKGADTKVVTTAVELIRTYGKEELTNYAKIHFKTTNKVMDYYNNKALTYKVMMHT